MRKAGTFSGKQSELWQLSLWPVTNNYYAEFHSRPKRKIRDENVWISVIWTFCDADSRWPEVDLDIASAFGMQMYRATAKITNQYSLHYWGLKWHILFSVCPAVPQPQSVVSLHQLCLLELPGEEPWHHPVDMTEERFLPQNLKTSTRYISTQA